MVYHLYTFLEAIKESGDDNFIPLGPTYVAYQSTGFTYDQFISMLSALDNLKAIKCTNEIARKGADFDKVFNNCRNILEKSGVLK
jgi:alanine-alpha-ketoisovalerate/valine-pyruvate aminotransferase